MSEQKAQIPEDLQSNVAAAFKLCNEQRERIAKLEADLLNAHAIARGVTHHEACCESSAKYKALEADNKALLEALEAMLANAPDCDWTALAAIAQAKR